MVMLTEVLSYRVSDRSGRQTPLADLCVALLEEDYPPVKHILISREGTEAHIPWDRVSALNKKLRRIEVDDLDNVEAVENGNDVRLRRDVLDALVIDLLGRRTTRVADLRLVQDEGSLYLRGADAGLSAMVRRLTGGRFGFLDRDALFDWKYVEFLRGDPSAVDNGAGYRLRITRLPAGEIARLADLIPYLHAAELVKLLPDEKAAQVLQAMSIERQVQVMDELPEDEAVRLISMMSPDLAADVVGRLGVEAMKSFLCQLPERKRGRILELLRYPEDSVGGVMINDVICFPEDMNGREAAKAIHDRLKDPVFISLIFVMDPDDGQFLRGVVRLNQVLAMDDDDKLADIMDPYVGTLEPFQRAAEAAHRILDSGSAAMPVIDENGRMVGAMTLDAAMTVLFTSTRELQALRIFS